MPGDQVLQTPFRIRQTGERLTAGREISRERLASLLQSNGYFRVDTVAEAGEFAIRGSIVDLFPAGSELGLRKRQYFLERNPILGLLRNLTSSLEAAI